MADSATVAERRERQRDAIWKWKWLGWRDSTPGFKGALVLLAIAALSLAAFGTGVLRF